MYLGFDFSTQQLKAIAVNEELKLCHHAAVHYDSELPEYRTHGGVHPHEDNLTVTVPTIMWVKSIDMLLEKLKVDGLDFSSVKSISGAAQQHGSVYWKIGSEEQLKNLSSGKFLFEQLHSCFSVRESPVWMDSSTTSECEVLEREIGGALALSELTGSRAYERFTGSQIAKLFKSKPDIYNITERISLVSSFGASVFLGRYAPIDYSDGCGMNLLDIRTKDWSDNCLQVCACNLREKLSTPVPSCSVLGTISSYFVDRYGFNENCKVVAFTGDNPASLAGTQLSRGDMTISLGTSDTVILWLKEPQTVLHGHIFCNPIDSKDFMALLCFKNGSLTRERIRDECANGSWQLFSELLELTPRGNFGNIGMYFDRKEILPPVVGEFRFNRNNEQVKCFSKEVEVRALIEGQFLAKRTYIEDLGFVLDDSARIIATGGASMNKAIVQVLSDILNMPVYVLDVVNSACLGSAFRAKHGLLGEECSFQSMFTDSNGIQLLAEPASDAEEVYSAMVSRYRVLQEKIVREWGS